MILVPHGEDLGLVFGDSVTNHSYKSAHRVFLNVQKEEVPENAMYTNSWGIFFTILGTVLLDFDADACQSPARAYLLDVTIPGKPIY